MQGIGDFLKRYLNFTPPALVRSHAVAKAIQERFGVVCADADVEIRGDVAFIRAGNALKSEIRLNKEELLARVASLGGGELTDFK